MDKSLLLEEGGGGKSEWGDAFDDAIAPPAFAVALDRRGGAGVVDADNDDDNNDDEAVRPWPFINDVDVEEEGC